MGSMLGKFIRTPKQCNCTSSLTHFKLPFEHVMFKMFPRNHFLRALTIFSVLSSKKVSSRSLNAKVRYLPSSDIRISPSVSTLKEPNMLFFKCFLVCSLRAHSHYHSNLSQLFVILCWHFLTCVIEKVTPVPWNLDTFSWNIIPSTVFVSCQLLWFYNHIFFKGLLCLLLLGENPQTIQEETAWSPDSMMTSVQGSVGRTGSKFAQETNSKTSYK